MKTYAIVNNKNTTESHVYLIVNDSGIITETKGSRFSDRLYLNESIETIKKNLEEKGYTVKEIS